MGLKSLGIIVILFTSLHALAYSTSCQVDRVDRWPGNKDYTFMTVDRVHGVCDGDFDVSIKGYGIGLRWAGATVLGVACTSKHPAGKYYGMKSDLAFFLGADGAVYMSRKGFCVVGGLNTMSMGVDVTGSVMTIKAQPRR